MRLDEKMRERAMDYAAAWWKRYEDKYTGRLSEWVLHLIAKSMIRAYKKGFYDAKRQLRRL